MRIAQPYDYEAAGLMCAGAKRRERSGVAVDALLLGYGTLRTIPRCAIDGGRDHRICTPMPDEFKMVWEVRLAEELGRRRSVPRSNEP
jgi:hypothetical protein